MDKWDYFCCLFTQKYSNLLEYLVRPIVNISSKGLTKQLNKPYGENKCQKYDLIYKDTGSKKPLLIYIHGGGFVSGVLTLRRPFCYKIASEENYFVANIDYRVAPQAHFKEQMQDIFDAISAIYDKKDEYNFDITKVVVAGESAGGYFANYLGVLSTNKQLFDKIGIKFKYADEFNVKSTLLINGVYEMKQLAKTNITNVKSFVKGLCNLTKQQYNDIDNFDDTYFNSTTFVDSSYPPSVIHQGEHDLFGESTKELIKLFDSRNVEYTLVYAKGLSGNHAFTIAPINSEGKRCFYETFDKINEYINR